MLRIAVIASLVFWDSCTPPPEPEVKIFEITPTTVCPGGTVTIKWKVVGGVALLYNSDLNLAAMAANDDFDPLKLGDAEGTTTRVINKTTTFKAASWVNPTKFAASEGVLITVVDAVGIVGLNFASCKGSGWGSDAVAGDWTPDAMVTNVYSDTLDRKIDLTHAGHTWSLDEGGASNTIPDNMSVGGPWSATAKFKDGEGCGGAPSIEGGNPLQIKPPALKARAQYACK